MVTILSNLESKISMVMIVMIATHDKVAFGCSLLSLARQGKARQGYARQCKARQAKAKQGKARQGKAKPKLAI